MKRIILLLLSGLMCASCTTRPKVTTVDPVTGVKTTYDLGQTVLARTKNVLASIKVNGGPELKYSSGEEDSTEVGKHLITTGGLIAGGVIANRGEQIRETGSTTRHVSTENAGVTKHLSDNATTVTTKGFESASEVQKFVPK